MKVVTDVSVEDGDLVIQREDLELNNCTGSRDLLHVVCGNPDYKLTPSEEEVDSVKKQLADMGYKNVVVTSAAIKIEFVV